MPPGGDAMFFLGTTPYQLDDKNRVAIPPKYRAEFVGGGVLTTGEEPCVMLYTIDGFETRAAQYIEIDLNLLPTREYQDVSWPGFAGAVRNGDVTCVGRWSMDPGVVFVALRRLSKCLGLSRLPWSSGRWGRRHGCAVLRFLRSAAAQRDYFG